jgi:hypothetical protein
MSDYRDVGYLEFSDFQGKKMKAYDNGKPTFCKIYSPGCPHCVSVHKDVQKLIDTLNQTSLINICVIDLSGPKLGEQELSKNIDSLIPGFQGVPSFVMFKPNGDFLAESEVPRNYESWLEWIGNNMHTYNTPNKIIDTPKIFDNMEKAMHAVQNAESPDVVDHILDNSTPQVKQQLYQHFKSNDKPIRNVEAHPQYKTLGEM